MRCPCTAWAPPIFKEVKNMNFNFDNVDELNDSIFESLFGENEDREPVALYMRYSSDNQTENSIKYQRAALRSYCLNHNMRIVREYADRERTGKNDKRLEFQRLIEDAQKKPRWKKVLVYKLNRYFRNAKSAIAYDDVFADHGIEVISVTQQIDNSPSGRLMRHIFYVFDEFQSDLIAEHTHMGMMSKASEASHCGGKPPLGYDIDNKRLVINEQEAEIVHMIFKCIDNGCSYVQTAKLLNEKGYRTKQGKPFTKNSFDLILSQEKYIGVFTWNKTRQRKSNDTRNSHAQKLEDEQIRVENAIPAIIDRDLFDRVQQKRDSRV